jgi:hypothetical protein
VAKVVFEEVFWDPDQPDDTLKRTERPLESFSTTLEEILASDAKHKEAYEASFSPGAKFTILRDPSDVNAIVTKGYDSK